MNNVSGLKDGRYDFMAELSYSSSGTSVYSARLKTWGELTLGNILDDFENWMRDKARACPEVG